MLLADARRPPFGVNGLDLATGRELDALFLPERPGAQREIRAPAGEELLRQSRALVGRMRLAAGEDDATSEAERAEVLGAAGAGQAGARDQDGPVHAAFTSST